MVEGWSVIDRQTEFDPPKRSLHIMDFCQDTGVSVWWCFFFLFVDRKREPEPQAWTQLWANVIQAPEEVPTGAAKTPGRTAIRHPFQCTTVSASYWFAMVR